MPQPIYFTLDDARIIFSKLETVTNKVMNATSDLNGYSFTNLQTNLLTFISLGTITIGPPGNNRLIENGSFVRIVGFITGSYQSEVQNLMRACVQIQCMGGSDNIVQLWRHEWCNILVTIFWPEGMKKVLSAIMFVKCRWKIDRKKDKNRQRKKWTCTAFQKVLWKKGNKQDHRSPVLEAGGKLEYPEKPCESILGLDWTIKRRDWELNPGSVVHSAEEVPVHHLLPRKEDNVLYGLLGFYVDQFCLVQVLKRTPCHTILKMRIVSVGRELSFRSMGDMFWDFSGHLHFFVLRFVDFSFFPIIRECMIRAVMWFSETLAMSLITNNAQNC